MRRVSNPYRPVLDAMAAGTPHDLICSTCSWTRLCIQPPDMTRDEVTRGIENIKAAALRNGCGRGDVAAAQITAIAIYGGRDSAGAMCPVLIARLRSPDGRQVLDQIRALMRDKAEAPAEAPAETAGT